MKSRWVRSMLPPVVAAVLLVYVIPRFLYPGRNAVYRRVDGSWQRLPDLPGDVSDLRVSPQGTLWAVLRLRGVGGEIARWDGDAWRVYTTHDLGGAYPAPRLAFDGEDLWTPADQGALHWDGRVWKYQELMPNVVSSLIADHGEVWAIDVACNLWHFDGKLQPLQKLHLPGAVYKPGDEEMPPRLARTGDGSFWAVRRGIWHWKDSHWRTLDLHDVDLQDADLVGSTANHFWVWNNKSLISVELNGTLRTYQGLRLGEGGEVYDVLETGDEVLAGTSAGILELEWTQWSPLAGPPETREIGALAIDRGGNLVALARTRNVWRTLAQLVERWQPLLLALAMLAIPVWSVRRYKRQKLSDHTRMQKAMEHGKGAVPDVFVRDK